MKGKEIFMYALAGLATVVFLILCVLVFVTPIPNENNEIAVYLLGQFAVVVIMIYTYFFGSSKGSSDKTEIMNQQKIAAGVQTDMEVGSKININGIEYMWDGEKLIKQELVIQELNDGNK